MWQCKQAASPAYTELEVLMMDWMAKLFGLPEHFTFAKSGGGCIQNTVSDGVFYCMAAAREKAIGEKPNEKRGSILDRLVVYTSIEVFICYFLIYM